MDGSTQIVQRNKWSLFLPVTQAKYNLTSYMIACVFVLTALEAEVPRNFPQDNSVPMKSNTENI